jgi:hypothetical protein
MASTPKNKKKYRHLIVSAILFIVAAGIFGILWKGLTLNPTVLKSSQLGKVAADFDLILRASRARRIYRTEIPLSHIEPGGISTLQLNDVLNEKQEIRNSNFGRYSGNSYLGYFWTLSVKCKVRLREAMSLRSLRLRNRDV